MKVYDKKNVASSLQYELLIEALRKAFGSKISAPERVQHTIKNKNGRCNFTFDACLENWQTHRH